MTDDKKVWRKYLEEVGKECEGHKQAMKKIKRQELIMYAAIGFACVLSIVIGALL